MSSPTPPLRIVEFLHSYGPAELLTIALTSILALPNYSIPSIIFQVFALQFHMYIFHVLLHRMPEDLPFTFNTHLLLHHRKHFYISRTIELMIEAVGNFSFIFMILPVQYMLNLKIFSTSIVLSGALLYTMMHIIQYSIFTDVHHSLHHVHETCNYEPEIMDTFFGTRCEPDTPYKDMSIEIPYILITFVVIGTLKVIFDFD
jgi:hypothetical protein